MYVCIDVCMYDVCMYACMYACNVCMYVCIYVCLMCVCMYVCMQCMYVRMFACMYAVAFVYPKVIRGFVFGMLSGLDPQLSAINCLLRKSFLSLSEWLVHVSNVLALHPH